MDDPMLMMMMMMMIRGYALRKFAFFSMPYTG